MVTDTTTQGPRFTWGDELMDRGFTSVPNLLLDHYADLKISQTEVMLVLHISQHWWGREYPFPSVKTLATKMDLSERRVQELFGTLVKKGYMRITARYTDNGAQSTNSYDLSGLLQALKDHVSHLPGDDEENITLPRTSPHRGVRHSSPK